MDIRDNLNNFVTVKGGKLVKMTELLVFDRQTDYSALWNEIVYFVLALISWYGHLNCGHVTQIEMVSLREEYFACFVVVRRHIEHFLCMISSILDETCSYTFIIFIYIICIFVDIA